MVRVGRIDIDGLLTACWKSLPGAVEALREIRAVGGYPSP